MKIVTLNLRHGGGSRVESICDYLESQKADVIVCTEFRRNAVGMRLMERLVGATRTAFVSEVADSRENGVLIVAPLGARPISFAPPPGERKRIIACQLGDTVVVGVYFAGGHAKQPLFDYLHSAPFHADDVVVIGDFNTGRHRLDETGATFICTPSFIALPDAGLHDLWRHIQGELAQEFTWYSRSGNPFRIDHAFGTDSVRDRVLHCAYDHSTRPLVSDHSAMSITLAPVRPGSATQSPR